MQNPAIRTLKAIREIHNEAHQWQVHMGDWHSEMTQTTWQFATPSAISILAAVMICRFSAVACWFLIFFSLNISSEQAAEFGKGNMVQQYWQFGLGSAKCLLRRIDSAWRTEQWAWY